MPVIFLLFIGAIVIPFIVSFIVTHQVRKQLDKEGHKHAKIIGAITFICCFALIFFAIAWASNFIPFER